MSTIVLIDRAFTQSLAGRQTDVVYPEHGMRFRCQIKSAQIRPFLGEPTLMVMAEWVIRKTGDEWEPIGTFGYNLKLDGLVITEEDGVITFKQPDQGIEGVVYPNQHDANMTPAQIEEILARRR